jgi:hypothetical protein
VLSAQCSRCWLKTRAVVRSRTAGLQGQPIRDRDGQATPRLSTPRLYRRRFVPLACKWNVLELV